MARYLSTIAATLLTVTALVLCADTARTQELVPLQSFNAPPAFFGCVRRVPDKVCHIRVNNGNEVCDWVDPPQYDECWWEPKGLSGGDRIAVAWECCAPAGQVGFVLQVSDTINSLKGLRVGGQTAEIQGRGQSFPNTPWLRSAPLFWDLTDTSTISAFLSANRNDRYEVSLSELRPYAGRIAVFRWISDWGPPLAGWPPANLQSTASGAPVDGVFIQEPAGTMWTVFGETLYPIAEAASVGRIWGPRAFYKVANGLSIRNVRSIPDDNTTLKEENGTLTAVTGGARFVAPDTPTLDRFFAGITPTPIANGGTRLIPTVPRDGTLLREESGAIWVLFGGAKFRIPDEATLSALYTDWPIQQLWNSATEPLPRVPIDATLLRELNGDTWVVLGGARFHIPDPPTYQRLYGSRLPFQLWNGSLEQIRTIPNDGALFREESGAVWAVAGQARFPVPDLPTLARAFPRRSVFQTWNGALSDLQSVPVDGTLIQQERDGVSVVYGGAAFRLPDAYTLTRLFAGRPVTELWSGALANLRTVPVDGTLLRDDIGRIWVVVGGAKFGVPDTATLQRLFAGRTPLPLWTSAIDRIPVVPDDGSLFREEDGTYRATFGGARFTLPAATTVFEAQRQSAILQRYFPGQSPFILWNGALAAVPVAPSNGSILREENGTVSVIFGGARFTVPDPPTLQRLYANRIPYLLWTGAPQEIPLIPRDRTLLREENGAIWVIYGGAKFHVPDPATLQRLFAREPVFQVWNGALNAIGEIPSNGTCLGEEGRPERVYQIAGACKQPAIPQIVLDSNGNIRTVYPGCPRLWSDALSGVPAC